MTKQSLYEWCIKTGSDLNQEWHPSKNGNLTPHDVARGSSKKVWWQCSVCGYEWQATLSHRTNGRGCPQCGRFANIKARSTPDVEQSLADINPELIRDWHPNKNGEVTPYDFKPHSGRKVWWCCSRCGYEWQATIASRSKGSGCPNCKNSIKTSFGEKAIYYYLCQLFVKDNVIPNFKPEGWGGLELDVYVPAYKIAVEFDGPFHDELEAKKRDIRKTKACLENGIILIRIRYPGLLEISGGYNCHMSDKTDYSLQQAIINALEIASSISGRLIDFEIDVNWDRVSILELQHTGWIKSSILESNSEYLAEWNTSRNGLLRPEYFQPKSNCKVWWRCSKCGHEWEATIAHRTDGDGCPNCANIKRSHDRSTPLPGKSLADLNPELAREWHPINNGDLTPFDVKSGSNRKVWWICPICGNEWMAKVANRSHGRGCPMCKGLKISTTKSRAPEGQSLADLNPTLSREWHPSKNLDLTPDMVRPGSSRKAWWLCSKCGHEWAAAIYSRSKGVGCPMCARKKVWETRRRNTGKQ